MSSAASRFDLAARRAQHSPTSPPPRAVHRDVGRRIGPSSNWREDLSSGLPRSSLTSFTRV
jgi:hypothetical protein